MLKLIETTPPAAEPLSLDEVKAHLRLSANTDDAMITAFISGTREACEAYTGLALITRGYSLYFDAWPEDVVLPRPPLVGVQSVNIYAADDTMAAMDTSDYTIDSIARPSRIVLNGDITPPLPGRAVNGVEVRYTAGYGAATDVPALLKLGMKQHIAWLYSHRGDDSAIGADALSLSGARMLFQPYRLMRMV